MSAVPQPGHMAGDVHCESSVDAEQPNGAKPETEKVEESSAVQEQTTGDMTTHSEEAEDDPAGWQDVLGSGKLLMRSLRRGGGNERPENGQEVAIHYCVAPVGQQPESSPVNTHTSHPQGQLIRVGEGDTIAAFDLALALMCAGDVVEIKAQSSLAYQDYGLPPHIPPNCDVDAVLELLSLEQPPVELDSLCRDRKAWLAAAKQKKDRGNELMARQDFADAAKVYTMGLKMLRHQKEMPSAASRQPEPGVDLPDQQPIAPETSDDDSKAVQAELKTVHVALCNNVCQAMIKSKNWALANDAANEALALDPTNPKTLYRLGEIHLIGLKEAGKATGYYEKALAANQNDPMIKKKLAMARREQSTELEKEKQLYTAMLGGPVSQSQPSSNKPIKVKTGPKVRSKARAVTMSAAQERRQGCVNMSIGIVITMLVMYVLYILSGYVVPSGQSGDMDIIHDYDYQSEPPVCNSRNGDQSDGSVDCDRDDENEAANEEL